MEEERVIIVGAGPSGLATAACLAFHSIPSLILERDDCIASLWQKRTYDRLHLHLAKEFCELPHFPYPPATPTYVSRDGFIRYLNDYAEKFNLHPKFHHEVESASFDQELGRWRLKVKDLDAGETVLDYVTEYLVVASGENDEAITPRIPGLDGFGGEVMHSREYRSGLGFKGKDVLVVGSGNSGMEIAYDLSNFGARTSIVVRSPLHLVSREIWHFGMNLMKILPLPLLDPVILFLCNLKFGNTSKYGIDRPSKGPFYLKKYSPVYPVVDVGTFKKIKSGEIRVLPSLTSIEGKNLAFADGKVYPFDAIVFATGFKSTIKNWLKDDDYLIGEDGMCKQKFPIHWKGKNGLYCSGLVRRGLYGSAEDAISIANDIKDALQYQLQEKNIVGV